MAASTLIWSGARGLVTASLMWLLEGLLRVVRRFLYWGDDGQFDSVVWLEPYLI